ncbi:hypothetical protein THAOC_20803, partial [Thalassiosira oceanica]
MSPPTIASAKPPGEAVRTKSGVQGAGQQSEPGGRAAPGRRGSGGRTNDAGLTTRSPDAPIAPGGSSVGLRDVAATCRCRAILLLLDETVSGVVASDASPWTRSAIGGPHLSPDAPSENTPRVDLPRPKTDAASAPGGTLRGKTRGGGGAVVPSDPRRSTFVPRFTGTLAFASPHRPPGDGAARPLPLKYGQVSEYGRPERPGRAAASVPPRLPLSLVVRPGGRPPSGLALLQSSERISAGARRLLPRPPPRAAASVPPVPPRHGRRRSVPGVFFSSRVPPARAASDFGTSLQCAACPFFASPQGEAAVVLVHAVI